MRGLGLETRSWPENRMASLEENVKVLRLHLKHQRHKARQGNKEETLI